MQDDAAGVSGGQVMGELMATTSGWRRNKLLFGSSFVGAASALTVAQTAFARRPMDTPAEIVVAVVAGAVLAACIMIWMTKGTTWPLMRLPSVLAGAGFGAMVFWLLSFAYLLPRLIEGERDTDGIHVALFVLKFSGYATAVGLCLGVALAFILWRRAGGQRG